MYYHNSFTTYYIDDSDYHMTTLQYLQICINQNKDLVDGGGMYF